MFEDIAPDSLDKIFITPNDSETYKQIIREYSPNASPTEDNFSIRVGMTIPKFIENRLSQIILIREEVFIKAIFSSNLKDNKNSLDKEFYMGIFFHEICHINDIYLRYKHYNKKQSNMKMDNLAIPKECNEYFMHKFLSHWGAFSSQSFSETWIVQSHYIYIKELINLIDVSKYNLESSKTLLDKLKFCYKIGYHISLVTARITAQNFKITETQLAKELHSIIPTFINHLSNLHSLYEK